MWPFVIFLGGLLVLLIATSQLIRLATKLAYFLRLSPLIIGITVVAIGTSLPELAVSTIASVRGDFGLAVGNIIGSNIINVLLVLALGITTSEIRVGTTKTQRNIFFLTLLSAIYLAMIWLQMPAYLVAGCLLGLGLLFTIMEYVWGVAGRKLEDRIWLKFHKETRLTGGDLIVLSLCLGLIFVGGYAVVVAVKEIALITGVSTNILGLSVTAVATSLPEILTTVMSSRQKQGKLLLGNIIGSNVYNLVLIGGIASLWLKNYRLPFVDAQFFVLATLVFYGLLVFYKGKVIPRFIGVGLLAVCASYFLSLYSR